MCVCRYVCDHEYSLLAHFPKICSSLWLFQKQFFSFLSRLSSYLSFNSSLLPSHCPFLLRHPSHRASLPFTLPINFSTFLPLPAFLHPPSFFYSSSMILSLFFSPGEKNNNTGLLAAGLSPAFPNLSLLWYWLAGASAVLVLAGSSR